MLQFDYCNIFQMGWFNHQLEIIYKNMLAGRDREAWGWVVWTQSHRFLSVSGEIIRTDKAMTFHVWGNFRSARDFFYNLLSFFALWKQKRGQILNSKLYGCVIFRKMNLYMMRSMNASHLNALLDARTISDTRGR